MKRCSECGLEKDILTQFTSHRKECKLCEKFVRKNRTIETWANEMIRKTTARHQEFQTRAVPKLGEYDLDAQYLIDLYKTQNGRCSISGMKMVWSSNSDWMASVERIDDGGTYNRNNITLIVSELNCAQKWTPEKFRMAVEAYTQL